MLQAALFFLKVNGSMVLIDIDPEDYFGLLQHSQSYNLVLQVKIIIIKNN